MRRKAILQILGLCFIYLARGGPASAQTTNLPQPLKLDDAVDLAKGAQDAAATVVDKVKGKDFDAEQVAFGTIREACRDCHFSHRQTTGTGFVIKP